MTRKDAIRYAHINKGHIYTTDELWEDDENCILEDSLGNLIYGNGELVEDESMLPEDGWWDATEEDSNNDFSEHNDYGSSSNSMIHHDSVLWDENDEF